MAVLPAGPVNPHDLVQLLADEPKVLARVAVDRQVSPPRTLHLRLQVPGEDRPRRPLWYPYLEIGFWIGLITGQDAANWIVHGADVPDGSAPMLCPFPMDNVVMNAERHPSQSRSPSLSSEWPFVRADWRGPSGNVPQARFLVGPELPFVSHSELAIAQFIYELQDTRMGSTNPGLRIDWQDRTARIGNLSIAQDLIKVQVRGDRVDGLQLGLGTEDAVTWVNHAITRPSTRLFHLRHGVPNPLWVMVSKGSQWLDYRYIQQTTSGWTSEQGELQFDAPDLPTQIQAWIAGWETETLEFKETLTDDILEDVCAFANGVGGTILLGVRNKTRSVVGLTDREVDPQMTAMFAMIRTKIDPEPTVTIESCEIGGKLLLVATVAAGTQPPYGVKINQTRLTYYVRRGGSNYEARPIDLRTVVEQKASPPVSGTIPPLGGWGQL